MALRRAQNESAYGGKPRFCQHAQANLPSRLWWRTCSCNLEIGDEIGPTSDLAVRVRLSLPKRHHRGRLTLDVFLWNLDEALAIEQERKRLLLMWIEGG